MLSWFKEGQRLRRIGRACGWAAMALLVFTMLTGYGITQFRIVTGMTFGVLSKPVSHKLHQWTEIPLLILTLTHVSLAVWARWVASKQGGRK
ncbi:MAG: hypothetical protein PVH62_03205 [Anaerolineae bacterium]|jgi:hypothetical protein